MDPRATVMSIDGISAFDLMSRQAMLQGLIDLDCGSSAFPFVALFYGTPSNYLWEDFCGRTHTILQGEDGEQGNEMMPLLLLCQNSALAAVRAQLGDGEVLFAFDDGIYTFTMLEQFGEVHALLEGAFWTKAGIRVHQGKTQLWNRVGENPRGWESLERAALAEDETAIVWRVQKNCPHINGASRSLGARLVTPILSKPIWTN